MCVCTPNATELRNSFFLCVCVCVCISGFFQEGEREEKMTNRYSSDTAHEKSQKQRAKVRDEGNQREIGRKY